MSRTRRVGLLGVAIAALTLPASLTAVAAAEPVCDDLLVTHRPDGSTGDVEAVAVTAQTLDRDVDGWATVGWEVAAGAEVRRVLVVSAAGVNELPASATVADGGVLELHFCGDSGATTAATSAGGADDAATTVVPDRAAPTGAVGSASGFVAQQFATRRGGHDDGSPLRLSILGATVGAALGGVVLLLSRATRHEVVR